MRPSAVSGEPASPTRRRRGLLPPRPMDPVPASRPPDRMRTARSSSITQGVEHRDRGCGRDPVRDARSATASGDARRPRLSLLSPVEVRDMRSACACPIQPIVVPPSAVSFGPAPAARSPSASSTRTPTQSAWRTWASRPCSASWPRTRASPPTAPSSPTARAPSGRAPCAPSSRTARSATSTWSRSRSRSRPTTCTCSTAWRWPAFPSGGGSGAQTGRSSSPAARPPFSTPSRSPSSSTSS